MITKNQIKLIRSLSQKKFRKENGLFVIEGEKLLKEAIQENVDFHSIYSISPEEIDVEDIDIVSLTKKELSQISKLKTPNNSLALIRQKKINPIDFSNWVICCESLNDPGNLGTIIRTLDWFGLKHLVLSNDSVDVYNEKVVQSSMGSVFRVNVHYMELDSFLDSSNKRNTTIFGATLAGADYLKVDYSKSGILLFGSESHGISDTLKKYISKEIKINGSGSAESLNLGVSVGIVLSKL